MQGIRIKYQRGIHTMTGNQMIIEVAGIETKAKAATLIGKRVVWKTSAGKELAGQVMAAHGNSGAVRVKFNSGMPGQSVGEKVELS